MLTVRLPDDLSADVAALAAAAQSTPDAVVAEAIRREAAARRIFGDLLDAAGSELDEDEVLALAVAETRAVRRQRRGA